MKGCSSRPAFLVPIAFTSLCNSLDLSSSQGERLRQGFPTGHRFKYSAAIYIKTQVVMYSDRILSQIPVVGIQITIRKQTTAPNQGCCRDSLFHEYQGFLPNVSFANLLQKPRRHRDGLPHLPFPVSDDQPLHSPRHRHAQRPSLLLNPLSYFTGIMVSDNDVVKFAFHRLRTPKSSQPPAIKGEWQF